MSGPITIDSIKRTVGRHYRVNASKMAEPRPVGKTGDNSLDVSHARQVAMLLARELCPKKPIDRYSQKNIGRMFGGRDHSTVHYALEAAKRRIASDDEQCAKFMAVLIDLHLEGAK